MYLSYIFLIEASALLADWAIEAIILEPEDRKADVELGSNIRITRRRLIHQLLHIDYLSTVVAQLSGSMTYVETMD